jgi:hypothetical protein
LCNRTCSDISHVISLERVNLQILLCSQEREHCRDCDSSG